MYILQIPSLDGVESTSKNGSPLSAMVLLWTVFLANFVSRSVLPWSCSGMFHSASDAKKTRRVRQDVLNVLLQQQASLRPDVRPVLNTVEVEGVTVEHHVDEIETEVAVSGTTGAHYLLRGASAIMGVLLHAQLLKVPKRHIVAPLSSPSGSVRDGITTSRMLSLTEHR